MVRFASGPQDPLQDRFRAFATLFQGVQVVCLAEWLQMKHLSDEVFEMVLEILTFPSSA